MAAELDSARPEDSSRTLTSPLSNTMSESSGIHLAIHPEGDKEAYGGATPSPEAEKETYYESPQSIHRSGTKPRQASFPSTFRRDSASNQGVRHSTYDPNVGDQIAGNASYSTRGRRQSSTSIPVPIRRDSSLTYGQTVNFQSNNIRNEDSISINEERHTNARLSTTLQDSISIDPQQPPPNTQQPDPPNPAVELLAADDPRPSTSSSSLKSLCLNVRRRSSTTIEPESQLPIKQPCFWIFCLCLVFMLGIFAGFIVLLISKIHSKENASPPALPESTIVPQASAMPKTDSSIGAASVLIGTYFSTVSAGVLQTKLVYNDGKGSLCIRTKSGNDWLNVQCLAGANPRADTPLTVLDWLGGPSIYFITADNLLSGLDHMPLNDTWKFSTLRDQKKPAHPQSQLASVTWFNGTSAWVYYQDVNEQLREFGLDDYRGITWRDGSLGPLGLALAGTGIGASRWWLSSDGTEVLEVFVQVSGGAIHGRVYMESVWTSNYYAVNGTPNTVSEGAPLTSTVVHQQNSTEVVLLYVAGDGYLKVQSRGTANQTNTKFDAFSGPQSIVLGDGGSKTGIAAFDSQGQTTVFFVKGDSILEFTATDVNSGSYSTFTVTSA